MNDAEMQSWRTGYEDEIATVVADATPMIEVAFVRKLIAELERETDDPLDRIEIRLASTGEWVGLVAWIRGLVVAPASDAQPGGEGE